MEDATLHITASDLMNCFRTNRRQGFIAGVCFMIALNLALKLRDNATKIAETVGTSIGK